ncbi:phosphoenolpyruvate--protein phosphotransferase [Arcanobacterium bovis]|uniref:Phosphoenolpyruvate-protein phosphotransferase n=1 Tax=Arcanobacterium bovis TaxID=2529275 RepID=A0A4V2KRF2_9ACTO|nr:phosphoenolpyruvate--protein phosphotransferase [Arcanobacterium bovis]TBW23594.1 phosphoenolpyruvate--protein phosphotransferase [Arcanobacterium bovis]
MTGNHQVLHGLGVSSGIAAAKAVAVHAAPGFDANEPPTTDWEAASARVRQAMANVSAQLTERAQQASETVRPILEASAKLANDRGLAKSVDAKLKQGTGVTRAVHDATQGYADMLAGLGGYMAERVTDLYDIRDRTISELLGLPAPGVPELTELSVLVARDLAPAETATLSPELCAAILTEEGGPTSHTAILAAQLGIPAIVQVPGVVAVAEGNLVAVDGGVGEVVINPTDDEVAELKERAVRRAKALAGSSGEGATYDGHKVALLANIGTADDAAKAARMDLEGCGLFRTEFLFLDRSDAPSLEEQIATYTKVFESFGDRRIVVRTLDAGADKPLAFANLGAEENPALGRRGLRLCQRREDLLDTQLEALAQAYKATGADVRVMAPMIATASEARWFAEKVKAVGLPKAGAMVEIASTAILAGRVMREVDFVSIGTNDLSQYTMAADRMQGEFAELLSPWQPALLTLIKMTCEGGRATGKPVGVCGEAGGDPLLALVLVGLGVSSLSMAPNKVNAVRTALRLHDLATCQQMAAYAVDADDPENARAAVLELTSPGLKDLL